MGLLIGVNFPGNESLEELLRFDINKLQLIGVSEYFIFDWRVVEQR